MDEQTGARFQEAVGHKKDSSRQRCEQHDRSRSLSSGGESP
jgi:hypothetical protein